MTVPTNIQQAEKFLNQLSEVNSELPVDPGLMSSLFMDSSRDSLVSLQDLAGKISMDQGLTARVLARANSAYYGLQGRISSVSRAINILGISELRKILMMINMSSLAARVDKQIFDLSGYWEHQCSTGLIASRTALMCQYKDPGEAFTMGILHDLGKLMTAIFQPQAWLGIQKTAKEKEYPDHEAENSYWGIDHAIAGAMVLRKWNLPESITEAISWHHNPSGAAEEYRTAASILSLANLLSHELKGDETLLAPELFSRLDINRHEALQNAEDALQTPEYSGLKNMLASF